MKTKLICGVAINDLIDCKDFRGNGAYERWMAIITRCYNKKRLQLHPTYIGCSICDEWLIYSNFKKWFELNYIEGYSIDKDLMIIGNKVYSPEACSFIPNYINILLTDRSNGRGLYPLGVSYDTVKDGYKACISINGKVRHIGYFKTPNEAHIAWAIAKKKYVGESATKAFQNKEINEKIYNSLLNIDFLGR